MGGMGSGTWTRTRRKGKVEERAAFDIRMWKRNGWLASRTLTFRNGLVVATTYDRIHYKNAGTDPRTGRQMTVSEQIMLAERRCHLGGSRLMFVCPGCASKVFLLYETGLHYRCRPCVNLAYESQSEVQRQLIMRRGNYLVRRLDSSAYFMFENPARPSRMRHSTYQKIIEKVERMRSFYIARSLPSIKMMVKSLALRTGNPLAIDLLAAIDSGDYLDFEFPEIDLDNFSIDLAE